MKNFKLQKIKHPIDNDGMFTRKYPILDQIVECLATIGLSTFIIGFIVFGSWLYFGVSNQKSYIEPVQAQNNLESIVLDEKPLDLSSLGTMGDEILLASKEFDVPVELILGIANAESSMGTNFVHAYDHNCHNYWGIRKVRDDGSYLRCFVDDKAGARSVAKLLRNYYLDEGRDTPEKIVSKWVGGKYSNHWDTWVYNVKNYEIH